jgi:hypothetical protein
MYHEPRHHHNTYTYTYTTHTYDTLLKVTSYEDNRSSIGAYVHTYYILHTTATSSLMYVYIDRGDIAT